MQHRNKSLKTENSYCIHIRLYYQVRCFVIIIDCYIRMTTLIKSCKTDVYSVTNSSLSNLQALLNNTVEFTPKLIIQQKSNVTMALNLNDSCITSLYKTRF